MIKFFRQMRQQVLKENSNKSSSGRAGRYLKYAIGEIILVVIGILIALQVNTWNENRKNRNKKDALLKAMQVEFKNNLSQLDSVIYYDKLIVKSCERLLHMTEAAFSATPIDTMRILIQNTSWLWTFDARNGALRSGISSGEIHLIKNDSLVNFLFSWQDVVADAKENEDRTLDYRLASDPILERFVRKVDYRRIHRPEMGISKHESNYTALMNDPLFEDYLAERLGHTADALIELLIVKEQNQAILEMIDVELNKFNGK
ncbi:DUF6090 family protein [Namhaeicola litoreus]|uniref:DUF6090 family protein n=1 Tax=Namhaeicola litoreus TaxID=1052145 RepID=A0ABW3XZM4_9FLAO